MKFSLFALIVFTAIACSKNDATPSVPASDTFDETKATLLREGTLVGNMSYAVAGKAKIFDDSGKKVLLLDNFTSSNGPDLRVYLSTTEDAAAFINLGKLKSTTGKQSYEIPGQPDFTRYKFVLIWCQQFSVQFGRSETK